MKNIKKKMNDLVSLINSKKKNKLTFLGSLYSLTYLTTSIEPILQDAKNQNPEKVIGNNIDRAKTIFKAFDFLSNYSSNNDHVKREKNKSFHKMHENLWQKIWPEYSSFQDYDKLVEYRGKRLDFNKIKKQFFNKDIIDLGCGNGSISMALLKRGAKSATGIDFGKDNILTAEKWVRKYKFHKRARFKKFDILKFTSKKKYDFVVCSAVLHHLKNKKELNIALKKISKLCNEGAFFYFFIRGTGGIRYFIQDCCIKCFKDISAESIREELINMNISREKITHLVDWYKAIYLQTKPEYIISKLKKLKFSEFKRLKGPHKNDMDINQINTHIKSSFKFGTGELRYICQFNKSKK